MYDYNQLWANLLLLVPSLGPGLAQMYVKNSFQELAGRRQWSWLRGRSAFYPQVYPRTGTISVSPGSYTVTGTGTAFTLDMVGKQFRPGSPGGSFYPTYTILQVQSATQLTLDSPWIGPTITNTPSYAIFQCYFGVPADFKSFYSLTNPSNSYRLYTSVSQSDLDRVDAQRAITGTSFVAAYLDYSPSYTGLISPTLQVRGAGPAPQSTTSYGYNFPSDSIYTVEITGSGVPGVATFQWKQDSGAYTTGILSDPAQPSDLSNGVQIYFPDGTYINGDTFIIPCQAVNTASSQIPRYELWPRPAGASPGSPNVVGQYVYPYIYTKQIPDLSQDQPALPEFIAHRGDVLLKYCHGQACKWPGTDTMRNASYDLVTAQSILAEAERQITQLELRDDELSPQDSMYASGNLPMAPWLDGSFLQSHSFPPFF